MVDRLVSTLDAAGTAGLSVMPTLFTGHMSGVNWIPSWALGEEAGDDRFRVVTGGRVAAPSLANWYSDASILRAQSALAREVAGALAGHRALWAWDLGNENSNCVVPPDKDHAREWLLRMTDAIRGADGDALVTLGLHMEDLEQDRNLGPREAAEVCDFLTMHGYPGYAAWADGPTDQRVLPFLARLTRLTIYTAAFLYALGNGLMWPSYLSMLSKLGGDKQQGSVQGTANSAGSLASILGLILGGYLYGLAGPMVFLGAAAVIGVVFLMAVRMVQNGS